VRWGLEDLSRAKGEPEARATVRSGNANPKMKGDVQEPDLDK